VSLPKYFKLTDKSKKYTIDKSRAKLMNRKGEEEDNAYARKKREEKRKKLEE